MKYVDYYHIPNNASDTKTMQSLGAMLGAKPERLNQVVTLYPDLSVSMITEALNRVYRRNTTQDRYSPINAMSYTWTVQTHMIPKIKIMEDVTATGKDRAEFTVILERKYYDKGDTFRLENQQTLFVRRRPEKVTANAWRYYVTNTGNNLAREIDIRFATKGRWTQYVTNYFPELSERGYNKFMFNAEKHINYMSRHRVSDSWSGDFAMQSPSYVKGKAAGEDVFMTIDSMDKRLLDLFMLSRENKNLFSETNYDAAGKCLDIDDEGRDIPMGDGIIPQFSRFSAQARYNTFNRTLLDNAIEQCTTYTPSEQGNTFVFSCNKRLYSQFARLADDMLKERVRDAYFYTKEGKKITVGAEYAAYTWQGNTIVFMPNKILSQRFEDQGYGIMFDMGTYDGAPNIELMTLKGADLITGTLKGLGGADGQTSGDISTSVHGSERHLLGYSGTKVANPYCGFIMKENIIF